MLAVAVSVLCILAAVETEVLVCPIDENEVFYNIENLPIPVTSYELYTRNNGDCQHLTNPTSLQQSNFDPKKRIVICIHGYYGNPTECYRLKSAYLRFMDCNFIIINWIIGAWESNHFVAVRNVAIIGRFIANGLEEIKNLTGCTFDNVHIIGVDLGAHIGGFVGKYVWSEKIARITGLNPVGVCFNDFLPEHKLYISDAKFVDVILTYNSSLILGQPTGHLTFAPDGGRTARGCDNFKPGEKDSELCNKCYHTRAMELFITSLENSQCLHVGYICQDYDTYEKGECFHCGVDGKNCAALGIHAEKYAVKTTNTSIMMYLDTTFTDNYCLFQYHVEVQLSITPNSREEFGVMYIFVNRGEPDEVEVVLKPSANQLQRPESLKPGEKYQYLVQTRIGPESVILKTIHFLWVSYQCQEDSKLYVQCVTIVPMNDLNINRDADAIFAVGNDKPIQPETLTSLQISSSC